MVTVSRSAPAPMMWTYGRVGTVSHDMPYVKSRSKMCAEDGLVSHQVRKGRKRATWFNMR